MMRATMNANIHLTAANLLNPKRRVDPKGRKRVKKDDEENEEEEEEEEEKDDNTGGLVPIDDDWKGPKDNFCSDIVAIKAHGYKR